MHCHTQERESAHLGSSTRASRACMTATNMAIRASRYYNMYWSRTTWATKTKWLHEGDSYKFKGLAQHNIWLLPGVASIHPAVTLCSKFGGRCTPAHMPHRPAKKCFSCRLEDCKTLLFKFWPNDSVLASVCCLSILMRPRSGMQTLYACWQTCWKRLLREGMSCTS